MQYFPFKPNHCDKPYQITREKIHAAMKTKELQGGEGTKFAVADVHPSGPDPNKLFSPKDVIRNCIRDRDASFGGGVVSNQVFTFLGFPVGKKAELKRRLTAARKNPPQVLRLDLLLERLFRQKWETLPGADKLKTCKALEPPGVYLLAFKNPYLCGERVRPKDIWYVGMTNEGGLGNRLSQFVRAANGGTGHSAGSRFRQIWLKRHGQQKLSAMAPLYSYVAVHCETEKPWRSVNDLRNMGKVAALEYEVLAEIKRQTGFEPVLNKK
jgi:hypothetical protein